MKKFSLTSKVTGRAIILSVLFAGAMSFHSCKKESMGKPAPSSTPVTERSMAMRNAVTKVLKDFTTATAGGSSTTTTGSGSGTWASGISVTNYSTPTANVYQWSDPTTGTVFTFSESTGGGGGGLGQLAYAGKSFDYNYVLSIKASENDPAWSGFFNGRDLRGVVAIDGELSDTDFTLKNIALFFVATTGGSGSYKFIDFGASTFSTTDGLGEIIDLGDTPVALASLGTNGKVYVTAGGHVTVSDNAFEMESDAKIMEVTTSNEYALEGTIMFE